MNKKKKIKINEFIEKDELKEILDEQNKIINSIKELEGRKDFEALFLRSNITNRYFALQKKKYRLYIIIDKNYEAIKELIEKNELPYM